ncbi:MAG: FtsB family cell division protein [Sarcina sp.]
MRRKKSLRVFTCVGMAIIFIGTFVKLEFNKQRLNAEKQEVEQELDALKIKNDNLTNEFNDSKTDSYIERMARERLGMIKNGEKVVVD